MRIDKAEWTYTCRTMNTPVEINSSGGYTFEEVMDNKNCSNDIKYWFNIKGTSKFLFRSSVAESWELYDPWIINPVRNTNQIYLKFLNTSEFTEAANYYKVNKEYTYHSDNTIGFNRFWENEERKCESGIWSDGVYLTGRHYFTINYGRFRARPTDEDGNVTSNRKSFTFLGFIDLQYYLFHEIEECLLNGNFSNLESFLEQFPEKDIEHFEALGLQSFVAAKGRRKGWTAIIATGILDYNFTFLESSNSLVASGEKGHFKAMRTGVHNTKNWVDKETPWVRATEILGQSEHFVASFKMVNDDGTKITEGYQSEMQFASFKDNDFKGIGDSVDIINIEEPGKFDNLLESFPISFEPLIRDGEIRIGALIAGGTAGDMEKGGSQALSTIMYKPSVFGAKEYNNIYEETEVSGKSGWFIDDLWYAPNKKIKKDQFLLLDSSERTKFLLDKIKGNYVEVVDKYGNSYRYFADILLSAKRDKMRASTQEVYNKMVTQQPKYLSEAFLLDESSPFDVATAKAALGEMISREDSTLIEKGSFFQSKEDGIQWQIDTSSNFINRFPWKHDNVEGCWVIYDHPVIVERQSRIDHKLITEETARNRYIAGTDPIDWGSGETTNKDKRKSFAATFIIDTLTRNIVAEYVSRPFKADDYFEQLWRGLEYYNAVLLYENNLKSLYSYFNLKNKMYLLAQEPDSLKGKTDKNRSRRLKGFHATPAANSYARAQYNTWTLEQVPVGQDHTTGEVTFLPRMYLFLL